MKKHNLKNDTMNGSDLQRVYNHSIYPRHSKMITNKGFVIIDDGRTGGSHWCAFHVKHNKSYYFDSFCGQPDKNLHIQLPKPIFYHNYIVRDVNSKLYGSYCL